MPRYLHPDSDEPATETSPPCDEDDLQNTEDIMAKLRAKGKIIYFCQ